MDMEALKHRDMEVGGVEAYRRVCRRAGMERCRRGDMEAWRPGIVRGVVKLCRYGGTEVLRWAADV
jgi:hypothetical protein